MVYESELYHHGILGQKWGKRNGPPYPLGSGSHSVAEKKAASGSSSPSDNKKSSRAGMSEAEIDAVAYLISSVAATAYIAYMSGAFDPIIKKGRDFIEKRKGTSVNKNGIKKLNKSESLSSTLKETNPYKGKHKGQVNCVPCSIAATLRQKGYDVEARPARGGMDPKLAYERCFNDIKFKKEDGGGKNFTTREDAANTLLKKYGNNASGVCAIQWKGYSCGHIWNWEINNGKVTFYDAQSGFTDKEVTEKFFNSGRISADGYLQTARTDNCTFNEEGLSYYVKNKSNKK